MVPFWAVPTSRKYLGADRTARSLAFRGACKLRSSVVGLLSSFGPRFCSVAECSEAFPLCGDMRALESRLSPVVEKESLPEHG